MPLSSSSNPDPKKLAEGVLYVVATPIGNLEDITLRAVRILAEVDMIAAEDTRHTAKLLSRLEITAKLVSCHEHNELKRSESLIARIREGASVALVSDAGTPSVSDPGFRLVRAAIQSGVRVVPIPGVSAAVTALSVAGLPTDSFIFSGFPPRKRKKRKEHLSLLAEEPRTLIFYESPRRVQEFIGEIIDVMGDRMGVLSREMTKIHEEFIRGKLSEISVKLAEKPAVKGECTLVVSGREEGNGVLPPSIESLAEEILAELSDPEKKTLALAKELSKKYGISKKTIYDEILRLKNKA